MSAVPRVEEQPGISLPILASIFECGMENAMSHPSQKSVMETFRKEAKKLDGHQTSSVANKAAQDFVHAVAINMTANPLAQPWCGLYPDVECSLRKVSIIFTV